jgi:hypothetical protein
MNNNIQIIHNIEHLFEMIKNKEQSELFKTSMLKVVHKYAKYFSGNRNHFQEYSQNRITVFGLISQLKTDIVENIRQHDLVCPCGAQNCHVPGPAVPGPAVPGLPVPGPLPNNNNNVQQPPRMDGIVLSAFINDLVELAY